MRPHLHLELETVIAPHEKSENLHRLIWRPPMNVAHSDIKAVNGYACIQKLNSSTISAWKKIFTFCPSKLMGSRKPVLIGGVRN